MKQLIPIFSLAVLIVACKSNPGIGVQTSTASQVQQAPVYNPDTAGLAQFQVWKAANELAPATAYKASVAPNRTAPIKKARKVYAAPVPQPSNNTAASDNSSPTFPGSTEEGTMSSESANPAKAAEKKGISKAAKGAAIGAGTGAVAGAVIGKKNRVVGGVIGGVVGGAVGYGIGRHMDKKDGRY